MSTALQLAVWLAGLVVALYASEQLVHSLTVLGAEFHLRPGPLGFLVALGADAPEVTSAIAATAHGSSEVGLGVVVGSNIYNLAALLGLGALVAGSIAVSRYRLMVDGGANVVLTAALIALVFLPALHQVLAVLLLLLLAGYAVLASHPHETVLGALPDSLTGSWLEVEAEHPPARPEAAHSAAVVLGIAAGSAVLIVVGSNLLVGSSLALGKQLGISSAVIGTFVLAIATSLPNTWAAVSLARRGLGSAALATAFSSNSINAGLGAGLPSLAVAFHTTSVVRLVDAPWLALMTLAAIILPFTRRTLSRGEGTALIVLYAAFVALRIAVMR